MLESILQQVGINTLKNQMNKGDKTVDLLKYISSSRFAPFEILPDPYVKVLLKETCPLSRLILFEVTV